MFGQNGRRMERHAYSTTRDAGLMDGLDTLVVTASNPGSGKATVMCGLDRLEVR